MNKIFLLNFLIFSYFILTFACTLAQNNIKRKPGIFSFFGDKYLLNGEEFQIIAGELHYSRIPQEYWRHRIQMTKAIGCNTLSVYIMWNFHEIEPGQFDFKSYMKDLNSFLNIASEEGMWVLIRPGPYVCGEWDFGGQPYWLLRDKAILRSTDKIYVDSLRQYINEVGKIIIPQQINFGGPIIMLQIENEYGYYGQDNSWPMLLKSLWTELKNIDVPLYHADNPGKGPLQIGHIPGAAVGLNGGTYEEAWQNKKDLYPTLPGLSSETYPGWLTHWGENWQGKSIEQTIQEITFLLTNQCSFSIYMVHGGTSFGFWPGANAQDKQPFYLPDITSYDYNAPINEQGNATEKYWAMRNTTQKFVKYNISSPPAPIPVALISQFKLEAIVNSSIFDHLPKAIESINTVPMEILNQKFGLILYRTVIQPQQLKNSGNVLQINELHDYANVYLGQRYEKSFFRGDNPNPIHNFSIQKEEVSLLNGLQVDILVENMGRINFDQQMQTDLKGITFNVTINGQVIDINNGNIWKIYPLPLNESMMEPIFNSEVISQSEQKFLKQNNVNNFEKGKFFKGQFTTNNIVNGQIPDTYLDMSKWSKGYLWVNGKNLGKYWNIGPQQRLYCPGVWLKRGVNQVVVFDFHIQVPVTIEGKTTLTDSTSFDEAPADKIVDRQYYY